MLLIIILMPILYWLLEILRNKYDWKINLEGRVKANFYICSKIIFSSFISSFYVALITLLTLYTIFFWLLPLFNLSNLSGFFYQRNYGFSNLNDVLSQNLILSTTQSLSIILPATLTFVLFIFREQRNSFESALNSVTNNRSILFFIIISLITIFYGYHLHYIITNAIDYIPSSSAESNITNTSNEIDTLQNTNSQLDRLDIWISLILLTFYFMYKMVKNMMRNINIRYILNETIKRSEKEVNSLRFCEIGSEGIRKEFYEYLYYDTESIFQMLKVAIEKNMDKVFTTKLQEWSTVVSSIHSDAIEKQLQSKFKENYPDYNKLSWHYKDIEISTNEYLLVRDKKMYEDYYKLILKNYLSLIMILYKNHKLEEAVRCIRRFFDLYPREIIEGSNKLLPIFITSLNELTLLLLDEKSASIKPFLEKLEELIKAGNYKDKKNLLVIYKTLISKTLEKGDVRLLTLIVYSMKKGTKEEIDKNSLYKINRTISDVFSKLSKKIEGLTVLNDDKFESKLGKNINMKVENRKFESKSENLNITVYNEKLKEKIFFNNVFEMLSVNDEKQNDERIENDYEEMVIYLILQTILKTIETTSYPSTGFLIKFIVTNFNSEMLIRTYKNFISQPQGNPYENGENTTLIMEKFDFNEQTIHYCLKKLVILLYGQQIFIDESKVEFDHLPQGKYINIPYLKNKELDYFYNKISKVQNGYGFSWITNDKFMKELKTKLVREILISSK
ncbi:hypothetical protein [Peribacillus frigoritolerans]|uniref:hypothetical protein n=1 Tax=Peribacillus frigoritolerans TaxID=450367 RepID=UPI0021616910|nr:hypothetical protein [Peribacillus frigoritolerans]